MALLLRTELKREAARFTANYHESNLPCNKSGCYMLGKVAARRKEGFTIFGKPTIFSSSGPLTEMKFIPDSLAIA